MTLRARLVAVTVVVVALALGGAALATHSVFTRSLVDQVDVRLDQTADEVRSVLAEDLGDPAAEIRLVAPGTLVQLRDPDGGTVLTVDTQPRDSDDPPPPDGGDLSSSLRDLSRTVTDAVAD